MRPTLHLRQFTLAAFFLLTALPAAWTQSSPRVAYVYPAGGQQGTNFSIAVVGQNLAGVTNVHISGGGAQTEVTNQFRPLSFAESNLLKEKLNDLQERKRLAAGRTPFTRNPTPTPTPSFTPTPTPMTMMQAEATASEGKPPLPGAPSTAANKSPFNTSVNKPQLPGIAPSLSPTPAPASFPANKTKFPPIILTPTPTPRFNGGASKPNRFNLFQKNNPASTTPPPQTALAMATPITTATWTAEDEKMLLEIREKLANYQRKKTAPAFTDTVEIKVTLAPDAEIGKRELRVETAGGISNPLVFYVNQLPEFYKTESKRIWNRLESEQTTRTETCVSLPAIINGRLMQGEVDRFIFNARKGQRLVAVVYARDLIPYIADAVPGWFQATLGIYDSKGKELAYVDDYKFNPDPVLYYEIPKDGEYQMEIKDSIYRGREDFVYRIAVGEFPFITSIYPLGAKANSQTMLEVRGWNLPFTKMMQIVDKPGIYPVSESKGQVFSNSVPFAVDTLPECMSKGTHNRRETAQTISTPVIVNGRIEKSGDIDVYAFNGRAGEKIVAEVIARRLGSPLDSVLKLTDSRGRQIAYNDDYEDKSAALVTHNADSLVSCTLPSDGTYYLHLADIQHKGGPDFAYRLRVSAPRPDFEIRMTPSCLNVRGGSTVPFTVTAIRRDWFPGEIALSLKNIPAGFTLSGGTIPANQDSVKVTLRIPPGEQEDPLDLIMEGKAMIDGKEVIHQAIPAEDQEQAFIYHHLVPAKDMLVDVLARSMGRWEIKIISPTPLKIPTGKTVSFQVGVTTNSFSGKDQVFANKELTLSEAPDGITIQKTTPVKGGGLEVFLNCDTTKAMPGLKGNLILNVIASANPANPGKGKKMNMQRKPLYTLPAIPYEIVTE